MEHFWILLLNIFCISLAAASTDKSSDTLLFVNNLHKKLKLSPNPRIILIIGNTGAGKSTFVHYAAGDYSRMITTRFGRRLKIVDGLDPEINTTTFATESRTLIPEMVVDDEGYVWYDCPGFGDTHNETVEIATSFLIENIIENASHVKFVLVTDYESVTEGYNRDSFDRLLYRTTQLIKNIERYANSLSLVISKVPQQDEAGELFEVDVKTSASEFIRGHRTFLQTKQLSEKKIQLIDAILETSLREVYPRISLFWRPSQVGPLSEETKIQNTRQKTRQSILHHAKYVKIQKNDFGFPLSAEARLEVDNITKNSTDNISNILQSIVNNILNQIQVQMDIAADFEEKFYIVELGKSCANSSQIENNVITLKQLIEHLKKCIQIFEIETVNMDFDQLEQQNENLHIFLSLIESGTSNPNSGINYVTFLSQIADHFADWDRKLRENIMIEAQRTKENISTALMNVDVQILVCLRKHLKSIEYFHEKLEWLGKIYADSILAEPTMDNKIKQFEVLIQSVNVSSVKVLNNLKQLRNNIKNMKLLMNLVIIDPISDWMADSSRSIKYLASQYKWYNFLQKTYSLLASYDVQKDVSLYNVAHLSNWGKPNMPQNLLISSNNFNEFVGKIASADIVDFKPTEANIQELNDIINVTLKSPLQYEYTDNRSTVTIKGNFITTSNILQFTNALSLKIINVFVVDIFYVDCDLTLNPFNEIQLNILAHTWDIRQASTFRLNGANGTHQNPPIIDGTAGGPGKAGMNGGNFFGFANQVFDGKLLSVELNGGSGGQGQDGSGNQDYGHQFEMDYCGNMDIGKEANKIRFNRQTFSFTGKPREEAYEYAENCFRKKGYQFHRDLNNEGFHMDDKIIGSEGSTYRSYIIEPRRCCGAAGRGGEGGVGGFGGLFKFIHTNQSEEIPNHTENSGPYGVNGRDGRKCRTFKLHVTVNVKWWDRVWNWDVTGTIFKTDHSIYFECNTPYISSGEEAERPKSQSNNLNYALTAVRYKAFLLENMQFKPLLKTVYETYNAIDTNSDINEAYSLTEFTGEMNELEKVFNLLKNMSPMYQSLLMRMDDYSKKSNQSNIDKKSLARLYLIVLSKRLSIDNFHNGDLIVDINRFFHIIIARINKLNENERIRVITEQRDQYQEGIRGRIMEANEYIKNDVEPEIEKMFAVLAMEMQKTLNQTIEQQVKQRFKIKKKEEKAAEIRRVAMLNKLFSISKIAINIFSVGFKALFKSGVGDIAKSFTNIEFFQQNYREKINLMKSALNRLINFVNATGNNSWIRSLFNLKSKVEQLTSNQSYHSTSNLLFEGIEFVNRLKVNSTNGTATDILQEIRKFSHIFLAIASNYQQYSEDNERLDELGEAISQDMETLTGLMELEDQIYTDLLPTINEMQTHLRNINRGLAVKSSVALDVMKWKTHEIIRSVQTKLSDAMSSLTTEYGVKNCLESIDKTMDLLIDIYNRIQNDQEQSRLISFLTDLQTINDETIEQPESVELQINLQANLILSLYDRALNAFKQAIFPYAAEYLDNFQLPSTLAAKSSNINYFTTVVTHKIQSLSENMQLFNATVINSNDLSIHVADFNNEPGSKGPFYVWPNHEVRDQIKNLFKGKKIYLFADVLRSDQRNAVKFSSIDIQFWSANQTIRNQLKGILETFHVSMTHMGESNYRCNNESYTISSRPLTIEFSFSSRNNKPTDRNAAYDKLVAGFALLSPYTMWAIQLKHGDFNRLKPYNNLVDIELHGFGQYVAENAPICDTALEKYYSLNNVANSWD